MDKRSLYKEGRLLMKDSSGFAKLFGGNIGAPIGNPYPVYAGLRDQTPCRLFAGTMFGDMYFVTPYDAVRKILVNPGTFSSRVNNKLIGSVIGPTLIGLDAPDHNRVRRIIMPFFTPRPIDALEDRVRAIANEMVDRFIGKDETNLVRDFTYGYPLAVFDRLILGMGIADPAEFHALARAFLKLTTNPVEAFRAVDGMRAYLAPVIASASCMDLDDTLLNRLALAEIDGERLSTEEIMSFLILLIQAGAETTFGLLGSAIWCLLKNDLWGAARESVTTREAIWRETLRFEAPVQFVARETTAEIEVEGTTLPQGAFVVASIGSANRDPRVFSTPDEFLIARDPKYWDPMLTFGIGPHYCAGAHLARMEFMVALEVLTERFPNLRLSRPADECEGIVGFPFRAPRDLPVLLS